MPEVKPRNVVVLNSPDEFLVGKKIGLFHVFPANDLPEHLPAHAVLSGSSSDDLAKMRANEIILDAQNDRQAIRFGTAVGIARLLGAAGLSAFAVVEGAPVQLSPIEREAFAKLGLPEPPPGRRVQVNPTGLATTLGTGIAGLGVVGTGVAYLRGDSALDAQQQLIAKLENELIAENPGVNIPGVDADLAAKGGGLVLAALVTPEGATDRPYTDEVTDGGGGDTTRVRMPRMWGRDP